MICLNQSLNPNKYSHKVIIYSCSCFLTGEEICINVMILKLFQESIRIATEEFQENVTAISADGSVVPRSASWSGLRFLLAEVSEDRPKTSLHLFVQ